MPIHYRDDIYLDKIIKQNFSASFMSDSKWLKLISALVDNCSRIKKCIVKPIWDDNKPSRQLLLTNEKQYGLDFYDSAMEAMVSGQPTGWYSYKEIEWLDFPAMLTNINGTSTVRQETEFIKTLIEKLGQYKIDDFDGNLRLYAYLP